MDLANYPSCTRTRQWVAQKSEDGLCLLAQWCVTAPGLRISEQTTHIPQPGHEDKSAVVLQCLPGHDDAVSLEWATVWVQWLDPSIVADDAVLLKIEESEKRLDKPWLGIAVEHYATGKFSPEIVSEDPIVRHGAAWQEYLETLQHEPVPFYDFADSIQFTDQIQPPTRPHYPVGAILATRSLSVGYWTAFDFVKVVGHTKTGAPRLRRLQCTVSVQENSPASYSANVQPTETLTDDGVFPARWSSKNDWWQYKCSEGLYYIDELYDSAKTYTQQSYG